MIKDLTGKRVGHVKYPEVKGTVIRTVSDGYRVQLDKDSKNPYSHWMDDDMYIVEGNIVELPEGLKVGDIVEPLESTIGTYCKTRKGRMIQGTIEKVYYHGESIKVKITKHIDASLVGRTYDVQARHFAKVVPGFSVGDIITGTPESDKHYGFTNTSMTEAKVLKIMGDGLIEIEILAHKTGSFTGTKVFVDPSYFKLVRKAHEEDVMEFAPEESTETEPKFKVGDIVTGTPEASKTYGVTTEDMTKGEVVEVNGTQIDIKVLEHASRLHVVGSTYRNVKAERFVLVEPEEVGKVNKLANGKVEIELPDGTEIEFEKYTDFLDFLKIHSA